MAEEKILVFDDHSDSLNFLLGEVLHPRGYQVMVATEMEECLRKGLWEDPRLIIVAAQFLSISTLASHQTIHTRLPDIPVVILASYGAKELAEEALRQGAKVCLLKPFTLEEVRDAVEETLHLQAREVPQEEPREKKKKKVKEPPEKPLRRVSYVNLIGKSIVSTLDLEKVFARSVEAGAFLTAAEEGSLLLWDAGEERFYLRAAKGKGDKSADLYRIPVEDKIAVEVLSSREPKMMPGSREHEWGEKSTGQGMNFLLYVPLKGKGEVLGTLCVFKSDAPFQNRDLALLGSLADYVAIAIENARLFDDLLRGYETVKEKEALPGGVERRHGERRRVDRRQGDRRVVGRRKGDRRASERRRGDRRQGERRLEVPWTAADGSSERR